ncbi:MAG TPA: hypothetical protein VF711_08465, partial [Acidimicrobiales bacterium]
MLIAANSHHSGFLSADDGVIDACVSMVLARLPEEADDSLYVTSLAMRVLARDGQFARIRQLLPRVRDLAERVEPDRPYLTRALLAFASGVDGTRTSDAAKLSGALGLTDRGQAQTMQVATRSWTQAADIA